MSAKKYRIVILILAYLCMLTFALTFQCLPPVLPLIAEEFILTHAEAGLLMSFFSLPTIFLAILAGLLADRLGPFRIGLFSLALIIMGTIIFAASSNFGYAALGRVIAGVGAATVSIIAAQILALWFKGPEVGTVMGVFSTAMPVGTILSFTSFGSIGKAFGWRIPVFIPAIMGAVALTTFLFFYKPAPDSSEKLPHGKKGLFSNLLKIENLAWLIGLCWMWFNATVISFSTFGPDFFSSKGYTIGFAGFLTSLLMWGSLILSPIVGRLVDKIGNHDLLIAAGGIVLAVSIFLVTYSNNFFFSMVVMAVAAGLIPTAVFSYQSKISKAEHFGLGYGILATLSSVGAFFGPYLTGFIRDETGSYTESFVFLSILALLVTITATVLRVKKPKVS